MYNITSGRAISAFPVSVATSLALESIFIGKLAPIDPNRTIPQKVNIQDYDEFWINLSTLFRNIIGALSSADSKRVSAREVADVLRDEVEFIQSLVAQETQNNTKTVFYVCTRTDLQRKYRNAFIRGVNTEIQKAYKALHDASIQGFLTSQGKQDHLRIFNNTLKPLRDVRALILTHSAFDLLSATNFKLMHLIESHTGILKKPAQWNTKYYQGKELSFMPFSKYLLPILGDSEVFSPYPSKDKNAIIDLAKKCNWTPLTTKDKILFDLDKLPHKFLADIIKDFP